MPRAFDWDIDWNNNPDACRFYTKNFHFGISTPKEIILRSINYALPASNKIILDFEASMPNNAQFEESHISIVFLRNGMLCFDKTVQKDVVLKPGDDILSSVILNCESTPLLQIELKISGDIILKKLTLRELPEELPQTDITLLEGTIVDISSIPDPRKSDYPDCRFTALVEGNSIIKGAVCPQKIQLIIDGFKNYKLLKTARLKAGDKIRCFITPFEKLSEEKQSTQQSDDLNLFDTPNFYVLDIAKIVTFAENSAIPFANIKQYDSVFGRKINPAIPDNIQYLQKKAIQEALLKIDSTIAPYNDEHISELHKDFEQAWEAEKEKDKEGFNRIKISANREYVWRNIDNSFWALPENYRLSSQNKTISQDNIDALLEFQNFLNSNGCQLIVGIVPDMHAIAARVINKQFRSVPDNSAWLVQQLLNKNIEVVYISEQLLKEYNRYPFAFFYPHDTHPSDTTQDIITDIFSKLLNRYDFRKNLDKNFFSIELSPHVFNNKKGYCFPKNCDIGSNKPDEYYLCRKVLYQNQDLRPDRQSPILVFGNSFIQTPTSLPDAFPSLLASKLHMGIDSFRINGSPMIHGIRLLFLNPEKYLSGKRVVVLILGIQHFFNTTFNNVRNMDEQMLQLSERTHIGTIPVCGNEQNIPNQFDKLNNARCFKIPADGQCLVTKTTLPDNYKNSVVVIPIRKNNAIAKSIYLKINEKNFSIHNFGLPGWNRIVFPLSESEDILTVELIGLPGEIVALSDIQVFK